MTERETSGLLRGLKPECGEIIARYEQRRSALLPIVHLFQQNEGFVSPQAMQATAEMLEITLAEVEGAVSFYTLFYRRPVGKYVLQVCRGLACAINGAEDIMAYFREKLGVGHLQTTADGLFSYEEVECLAACDRATCMQVNLEFVYDLTPQKIDEMLEAYVRAAMPSRRWRRPTRRRRRGRFRKTRRSPSGKKSRGAVGVSRPNNAGGVGDASGIIMLDNIINRSVEPFTGTTERAVVDSRAVVEVVEEDEGVRAGH